MILGLFGVLLIIGRGDYIEITDNELLQYAISQGIIDVSIVKEQIDMKENQKILKEHKYSIWQGKNGKWYTYLPDEQKGKVLKKRTTEEDIKKTIIDYYKKKKDEPTFKSVFEDWISYKYEVGEISKQTFDRYWEDYNRFIKGQEIEFHKVRTFTSGYLEDFIKRTIASQNLTNKAYSKLRLILRGTLIYAKKHELMSLSPQEFFGDLQLSKAIFQKNIVQKEDQVFSDEEEDRLWIHLKNNPNIQNYGIMFAFQTGLRIGEICTVKWSDINGQEIHIQRTEINYKGEDGVKRPHIREFPKSSAGDRYVYLSPKALWVLQKVKELKSCDVFIFGKDGSSIHEKTFDYRLRKACRECNIKPKSMHKIRKTFGTTLLDASVDDAIIMETMGHTDINCTKTYYYYSNKSKNSRHEQLRRALS